MYDHKLWIKLVNKVYEDKDTPCDAIFVHGWGDLAEPLIDYTAKLFKDSGASYIVLNGEDAYDGFKGAKGFTYWKEILMSRHAIPESAIYSYLPGKHTGDEAKGYMDFAESKEIKNAAVVSVPQHIVRAYLTDLGLALKRGLDINLSPRTIKGVNWEEEIEIYGLMGADDKEVTTRIGRIFSECVRIIEYRKRYEADGENFIIASINEGLDHLNK